MADNPLTRFFGGPPVSVIFRLIEDLVRAIWDMGFDALVWLWRYFLLGAVIVVPIWLIVRLMRAAKGR